MSSPSPLGLLEVSGLIRQAGGSAEQEYMFRHALLQETAYASLLRDERTELHLRVGRAMEDLYSEDSIEQAGVLAEHFLKGGEPSRAREYFQQAGDQAGRVYALAEALNHYGQALELSLDGYGEAEDLEYLYERIGRMFELSGQYERALDTYAELEEVGEVRGNSRLQLRGLVRRGNLLCLPNPVMDLEQGERLSQRALRLAKEADDREAQCLALWNLMKKYEFVEDYDRALGVGQAALKLARELDLETQQAFILNDLAAIYLSAGRFETGWVANQQAQEMWLELDNQPMFVDSLCNEMATHLFRLEFDEALEDSARAREISERIGNVWGRSYSRFLIYWVHFERGDIVQALETARRSVELGQQAGFVVPSLQTNAEIGLIHAYMGQYEPALKAIEEGFENADRYFPEWRNAMLPIKLLVHTWFDELDEAQELLDEIQENRKQSHERILGFLEFIYALAVPELGLAQRRYDFVLQETEWTLQAFKRQGIKLSLADTLYYRARALRETGESEEALPLLDQALRLMEESGSRRRLWSVLLTSADLAEQRGEADRAAEMRARARQAIEYIADHSESQSQREAFLSRPAVGQALRAAEES